MYVIARFRFLLPSVILLVSAILTTGLAEAQPYSEKVLYSFSGTSDGAKPLAGLTMDTSGNLYGTTMSGGSSGDGTVFKLSPSGTETVLHSFTGGTDGANPS